MRIHYNQVASESKFQTVRQGLVNTLHNTVLCVMLFKKFVSGALPQLRPMRILFDRCIPVRFKLL